MARTQEPKLEVGRPKFQGFVQGIYPQNMAKNVVV